MIALAGRWEQNRCVGAWQKMCVGGVALVLLGSAAQRPISPHAIAPEMRVDVNHASMAELMKVPGMTQTWAARIVRFRPYRAKNELLDRGVVTNEVYVRIKDYVIAHREKQ